MKHWYMLTLVGEDEPGIVAKITTALFEQGVSLGETSMIRLGGNFTIMMMISTELDAEGLDEQIGSMIDSLGLCMHLDPIEGHLHQHVVPNITVRVSGADKAGIVAGVTTALFEAGFNILDLTSDVAGSADQPVYIMMIEGISDRSAEELTGIIENAGLSDVDISITESDMLLA